MKLLMLSMAKLLKWKNAEILLPLIGIRPSRIEMMRMQDGLA
jgi:hypothetical protein